MAVDRTKVLEAAQKHLSKGAFDKAIVELQKLVKADPSDVRTWLKIGDLYVKLNQRPQAVDTYSRVADQYAGQGFFHKAVAVYKQILNLDGTRLDVKLKLAEMHEAMQLTSDAMATYEQVAAEYGRLGDADKALATFGKMVDLDPTNIPTRIKYAEALSRAGRNEEAAGAFEAGAELLKKQGRMDDYVKVVERLLFHREDVERSRELAELYLERNDGKRALAKLQVLFKADPKHIPTLELLAKAFEQVQQLPKTVSVLREVARLHGDRGNVDERARALKRILALDPGDPEARQALAQLAAPAAAPAAIKRDLAPPPGALIDASRPHRAVTEAPDDEPEIDEELEADEVDEVEAYDLEAAEAEAEALEAEAREAEALEAEALEAEGGGDVEATSATEGELPADDESSDVFIVEDEPVSEESAIEPAAPPPLAGRTSLPPDVATEALIAKLLTEVEVFTRYGLKQKVVEQLRQVIALDARHVQARERLKDVLVERGQIEAAAQELVALADLFAQDRPPVALLYLRQARSLDPDNYDVLLRLDALEGAGIRSEAPPPPEQPPAPLPTPVPASEAELAAEPEVDDFVAIPSEPAPSYEAAEAEAEGFGTEREPAAEPDATGDDDGADTDFLDDRTVAGDLSAFLPPPPAPVPAPAPVGSYLASRGAQPSAQRPAASGAQAPAKPAVPIPRPGVPLPKPAGITGGFAAARPAGVTAGVPVAKPAGITGGVPVAKPAGITGGLPAAKPAGVTGGFGAAVPGAGRPGIAAPAKPLPRAPAPVGARPAALAPAPPVAPTPEPAFLESSERAPIVPEPSPAPVAAAPSADLLAPMSPEEFDSAPLRPSQAGEPEPGRTSLPPGEVEEILDEAEFFVAQGLFDEGIGVLRDALAAHPKNRLLLDRIAEIEDMAARAAAARKEASQPPPPVDNSFQLAEKLADEIGGSSPEGSDILDVEEVFAQFKKGVEQQIGVEDTDTHFDLGIAYKEMGLLNDAIHEFELCIANQQRECMAHTMIGLCHLERADIPAAVAAFKRGLYAERKTDREEVGLYFELGRAYESMRDPQEALYYYEKVKKRDPKFLDVQDRIDALTKPQRPKAEPAAATEDLDAAFDELMGKE